MNLKTIALLPLLISVTYYTQSISSYCTDTPDDVVDYYWRDYNGVVPCDAVAGGKDKSGRTTYIGQVYYRGELLTGFIYQDSKLVHTCYAGKPYSSDIFVKILCSRHPQYFRWLSTKYDETHLLGDCHLVVGGFELGFVLNVGRVNHEMELAIGKVFGYKSSRGGFYMPFKDHEVHYKTYQILTYNCHSNTCSNVTDGHSSSLYPLVDNV